MSAVVPAALERAGWPLRTDSPRDLYLTFLRLSDEMEAALLAYTTRPTLAGAQRLALLSDQNETIGVRYETSPDQLRYLLAGLREMLHSHPRIDSDTVRVRFAGYGSSALNIDIRVNAETREWNDLFAIREDVFLRTYDLVTAAGADFAFPSQTLYMARDGGMDAERGDADRRSMAQGG